MIFFIEYTYDKVHPEIPKAYGFFHYVDADNEQEAIKRAREYIGNLLYFRFKEEVKFEIKSVEVLN
ncbi:hypothetical protein ACWIYZ_06750 [Ursidibacter arcticus]